MRFHRNFESANSDAVRAPSRCGLSCLMLCLFIASSGIAAAGDGVTKAAPPPQSDAGTAPAAQGLDKTVARLRGLGGSYAASGYLDLAIQEFSQALQLKPDDSEILLQRGLVYDRKGDVDRALQDFDQLVRLNPDEAIAFVDRGIEHGRKGDVDLSIRDFDQALRLKPDTVSALINRGAMHGKKGEYDLAIQDLDRAIELAPTAPALINRGVAHSAKGDFDLAIQDCDQAVRLAPEAASAFICRSEAHRLKGDFDLAIQDCDRAVQLAPGTESALVCRGLAYGQKGDFDLALRDYDQALRLEPDSATALNSRCWVRAKMGKALDIALSDCNAALASPNISGPNRSHALGSRGFVYFRLGQFDRAISDSDAALKDSPRSASTLYIRGLAKYRRGDIAGGEADVAAAKTIDPKIVDTFARFGVS